MNEGLMDKLAKRCRTICGGSTTGCFVANANHRECITDIVVNKIWAAREIIALGTRENSREDMTGILNIATREMDELIAWVQTIKKMQEQKGSESLEAVSCRQ